MQERPVISFAFPRPGRALGAILVAMTLVGLGSAIASAWTADGSWLVEALACSLATALTQPWRLVTSGLVTSPEHWSHLFFSLLGLYFLGAPLERRWRGWRLVRFLVIAVVLGNLATLAIDRVLPPGAQPRFHPGLVYGPASAIAAIAVAWSREYPDTQVNLFFVMPMRGRWLMWITLGFCVLNLIYPEVEPEGVMAPFGGVLAGLLFGGSPSLMRRAWLRLRLWGLRRRSAGLTAAEILAPKTARRPRPGAPPLRVVPGGLEDALKKRNPPKDKRFLN
jgi:membrane associated rhomboid family serine protease